MKGVQWPVRTTEIQIRERIYGDSSEAQFSAMYNFSYTQQSSSRGSAHLWLHKIATLILGGVGRGLINANFAIMLAVHLYNLSLRKLLKGKLFPSFVTAWTIYCQSSLTSLWLRLSLPLPYPDSNQFLCVSSLCQCQRQCLRLCGGIFMHNYSCTSAWIFPLLQGYFI